MVPAICTKNEGERRLGDRVRVASLMASRGYFSRNFWGRGARSYMVVQPPKAALTPEARTGSHCQSMRMLVQLPKDAPNHEAL